MCLLKETPPSCGLEPILSHLLHFFNSFLCLFSLLPCYSILTNKKEISFLKNWLGHPPFVSKVTRKNLWLLSFHPLLSPSHFGFHPSHTPETATLMNQEIRLRVCEGLCVVHEPWLSLHSGFLPISCFCRSQLAAGKLICKSWVHCLRLRLQWEQGGLPR